MKVCHLTSAHPRFDIRIFRKECRSLATRHQVHLVVADGLGDERVDEITVHDVGRPNGRMQRFTKTPSWVLKKALEIDAEVYHLHDPELMQIALKLKHRGKKVIFDAHEDLPRQLLSKPYLAKPVARIVSWWMEHYERYVCKRLDAVVTATPVIGEKFSRFQPTTVVVNNFPMTDELFADFETQGVRENRICYVGGVSFIRGITEMVQALELLPGEEQVLEIAGAFTEQPTRDRVTALKGFSRVNELGFLSREQVRDLFARCRAGIVTFLPYPNHVDAQPNKMFEYMSAGLPVIASNFPLWREIIEGNNCGICIDVEAPETIAKAIQLLFDRPDWAAELGANGRKAVIEKYNWNQEEQKLHELYVLLASAQ